MNAENKMYQACLIVFKNSKIVVWQGLTLVQVYLSCFWCSLWYHVLQKLGAMN